MIDSIKNLSEKYFNKIVAIRRNIHQNPELSFQEHETSIYIKSILDSWNISYTDNIADTGILAIIEGKNPIKKCIAVRADFDALPIEEENEVEYCSVNKGVMHACGHDVHTSSMLGAVKILNELKEEWEGTIKFIFQPAEERIPGGAKQMIEEGVLENPNVENVMAQHVFPDLEVGKVGFRAGMYMASTDEIYITVSGKGGHAALPEKYNSPIIASSNLIMELDNHFTKERNRPSVFAIGFVSADGSTNVIPKDVKLMGTFRAMDEQFRAESHKIMQKIAKNISEKYNLVIDFEIKKGYPFLKNDEILTNLSSEFAKEYLGKGNVVNLPVRMTAEDFSYFTFERPSCFYRLGIRNEEKGIVHGLHTSRFNIDEDALKVGMGLMSWLLIKNLGN